MAKYSNKVNLIFFSKFGQNESKGPYLGLKWSNNPEIEYYQVEMTDFGKKTLKNHYFCQL